MLNHQIHQRCNNNNTVESIKHTAVSRHQFSIVLDTAIALDIRENPPAQVENEKGYFKVVKAAFGQRRKTLLNSLSNSPAIPMAKDEILKVLKECGIDEKRRGETLTLQDFANITNKIFTA